MPDVLRAFLLAVLLAGCTTSLPIDLPDARAYVGDPGPGGNGGDGTNVAGSGGTSTAGTMGTAGIQGAAGQVGAGGEASATAGTQGGTGGTTTDGGPQDAGAGGATQDGAVNDGGVVVPTFTQLYTTMFNNTSYASNCAGGGCHNPGTQKGLDFSTQAKGYTTTLGKIKVGVPTSSKIVSQLASGAMPAGRPKMPAADQASVSAWIAAGALNN